MAQLAVRSLSTLVRIQPSANFYKRLFVLLSTVGTEIMKRKEARMFFKNIENVQNSFFSFSTINLPNFFADLFVWLHT